MISSPLVAEFKATGELKDLTVKSDGRVKYILLTVENKEDYWIEVAKEQSKKLGERLQPGCKIEVKGMLKRKIKKEKIDYKAYKIKILTSPPVVATPKTSVEPSTKKTDKAKKSDKTKKSQKKSTARVLICKKSNCWKKGGKESYEKLRQELEKKGITEKIDIKLTGCLKKCKKAANMIVLPDKKHYVNVKAKQIPTMVEKHFSEY